MTSEPMVTKTKEMLLFHMPILLVFYLPPILLEIFGETIRKNYSSWGMEYFVLHLFVVSPLTCLVCSIFFGRKHSFSVLFPLLVVVWFLPVVFVFYNSTAWVYALVYGLLALLGNAIGVTEARRVAELQKKQEAALLVEKNDKRI